MTAIIEPVVRLWSRLRSAWDKVGWGLRVVGPGNTIVGAARLGWLAVRRPDRSLVTLRSGGSLAFEYPSQLAPSLVLFGDLIDPEFAFLRRLSSPSWVVMDVGAAIGQFSVFAALLPSQSVHAYEPSDANLDVLAHNIAQNGVAGRVVVHRVALSNRSGEVAFPTASKTYLSRMDLAQDGSPSHQLVPVRRLDDELTNLGIDHLDVLKVNVAGYEPAVLDGAVDALAARRVGILILLIGVDSMEWYRRLADGGYILGFYHPLDDVFHRLDVIDERLLVERPWPARHLLAINGDAVDAGLLDGMTVTPLT